MAQSSTPRTRGTSGVSSGRARTKREHRGGTRGHPEPFQQTRASLPAKSDSYSGLGAGQASRAPGVWGK